MKPALEELFESPIIYPDVEYKDRFNSLIGLDEHKERLKKIISILINPSGLEEWASKYHSSARQIINIVLRRPPLIILEGDVGSGKSELALTIGDAVARAEDIAITLFPLSLSARGEGRVGQMTQLISSAFEHTIQKAKKLKSNSSKARGAVILLVDEADALAQSRENSQMHHEDKAGVNAFIRGIDRLGNGKLPAAVIMCTNRLGGLDPAVKRRAAEILTFHRPNEAQRKAVLEPVLSELGISPEDIKIMVDESGIVAHREYGFTFSDLTQRLLPSIVLDAYPDQRVCAEKAVQIVRSMTPTPPFRDNA